MKATNDRRKARDCKQFIFRSVGIIELGPCLCETRTGQGVVAVDIDGLCEGFAGLIISAVAQGCRCPVRTSERGRRRLVIRAWPKVDRWPRSPVRRNDESRNHRGQRKSLALELHRERAECVRRSLESLGWLRVTCSTPAHHCRSMSSLPLSNPSATQPADWYRASTFFSSAFNVIRSSAGVTCGLICEGGCGVT